MGVRVLVVDDDPWILRMVRASLEKKRFVVDTAKEGRQALQRAEANLPDVIISDVMMPVMDGWTFVQHLKQHPQLSDVPVIFLTALGEDEVRLSDMGLSRNDYLSKPFRFDDLEKRVTSALSKRPAAAEQSFGLSAGLSAVGASAPVFPRPTPVPAPAMDMPSISLSGTGEFPSFAADFGLGELGAESDDRAAFGSSFFGAQSPNAEPELADLGADLRSDSATTRPRPTVPPADVVQPRPESAGSGSYPAQRRGAALNGRLEQLQLSSLLVMMEMERKSGVLTLRTKDGATGRAFLQRGQVISAKLEPRTDLGARESVYEMLTWQKGTFSFNAMEVEMDDIIQSSTTHLLMEGARLIDEANRDESL